MPFRDAIVPFTPDQIAFLIRTLETLLMDTSNEVTASKAEACLERLRDAHEQVGIGSFTSTE